MMKRPLLLILLLGIALLACSSQNEEQPRVGNPVVRVTVDSLGSKLARFKVELVNAGNAWLLARSGRTETPSASTLKAEGRSFPAGMAVYDNLEPDTEYTLFYCAEGERLGLSAGELQGVEPSAHVDLLIMSTRGPMDGILSCILYLRTPLFFKHDSRMRDSAQKSSENLFFSLHERPGYGMLMQIGEVCPFLSITSYLNPSLCTPLHAWERAKERRNPPCSAVRQCGDLSQSPEDEPAFGRDGDAEADPL